MKSEALRVLFVTPECAPFAKVGGLGDVSAALPPALLGEGIDARILLPGYPDVLRCIDDGRLLARLTLQRPPAHPRLVEGRLPNGVPALIVDHAPFYHRNGGPYQDELGEDWPDNAMRFGLLSQTAALLSCAASPIAWRPHVVHLNDWPTALAPAYLRYAGEPRAASIVTIHNLAFQGNFDPKILTSLELPLASYAPEGLEFHGRLSFLKAGLFYANAITTVSPTYAREIQGEHQGAGLHGLLIRRRRVLHGILNGIDAAEWNPATDPHLPHRYGAETLQEKHHVKRALCERLGLDETADDVPLLGVVSRLTNQKGTDLLIAAAPQLARIASLAILGAGQRDHEQALRSLAARHPGRIAVAIGFDNALAHLIEGGADMFLMPSRFEPCGLNQMYSMRYGTPPVARATGGLADTIVDCSPATLAAGRATGFLFDEPDPAALAAAVHRAAGAYRARDVWRRLQRNGMARDFSWAVPARQYAALYRQTAEARVPD